MYKSTTLFLLGLIFTLSANLPFSELVRVGNAP